MHEEVEILVFKGVLRGIIEALGETSVE